MKKTITAKPVTDAMNIALGQMIRRVRRLIVMRGLSLVILAWLAGLAIAMTIDGYVVIYSTWARWVLSLVTYGLAAGVAFWTILRPLSLTFTPAGLARVIERRHPELNERISSAVELMSEADANDEIGSRSLIEALAKTAAEDIRGFDPRVEISIRKVMRYLAASAAALVVLLAVAIAWPSTAGRLALRSTLPILNLPNIHAAQLSVSPGDTVILKGDRLRVVLDSARSHVGDARLLVEHADNTRQQFTMQRMSLGDSEGARFSVMTDPVTGDFEYRIRGGDAVTRAYRVIVTPKPELAYLDISHSYPSYTGREPSRSRMINGDIRALTGTEVTVRAVFNKPLDDLALFVDGNTSSDKKVDYGFRKIAPDAVSFRVLLEPNLKAYWRLEGVDEHGFKARTREYSIESANDASPIVQIMHPAEQRLQLRPTDRVTLKYSIRDDYGVDLAGLILEADGRPLPVKHVKLPSSDASANRNLRGELSLDLDAYQLENVRQLAFQLRARDRRPTAFGGPQTGESRIFLIDLASDHKPHREQTLAQQTQRLRDSLSTARDEASKARESIEGLRQSVASDDSKRIEDSARSALDSVAALDQSLATVADSMRDGFYDGLRHQFTRDAGDPVVEAAESLSQIPIADERETQAELTDAAVASLTRSDDALEKMLSNLDAMHDALQAAVTTQDIAERQADLALALEKARNPLKKQAPPETRLGDLDVMGFSDIDWEDERLDAVVKTVEDSEKIEHIRKRQQHLADDLADMLEHFPEAATLATERVREQVDGLAAQAEELRKQQIEASERSDLAEKMADEWMAAAEDLKAQFDVIEEARREMLLPRTSLPLSEIASDLANDRLLDALEKIETVSQDLEHYQASIARERKTEELAQNIRDLFDEHQHTLRELEEYRDTSTPQTEALRDGLQSLAAELDGMREEAQEATPLALTAFDMYNPSEDFLGALTPEEASQPEAAHLEAADRALAQAERLQAAMETAAQAAEAERLAERLDMVAEEQQTMDHTFERLQDLAQRLTEASAPWRQELDDFAAETLADLEAARQQREAVAEELAPLGEAMHQNPIAATVPMEPLQQALAPLQEPYTPADEAWQSEQAAAEALRAAEALDAAMEQTREQADGALQRARDALESLAESTDENMLREAQWGLEEAELARQRDEQRVEEAEPLAEQLRQIAVELDEIAQTQRQADEQLAVVQTDLDRLEQAETLASEAEHRATAVAREAERLQELRERLEEDQQMLLAEVEDIPVEDARALAQLREEQTMPAGAESMAALAAEAADLASRQEDMAEAIAETQAAREEALRQLDEHQQGVAPDTPPDAAHGLTEQLQTLETGLAELAAEQQAMAHEAQQLRQQAAELAHETSWRPEELMDRAALAMLEDPVAAEPLARRAIEEQMQFAEELAQLSPMIAPDEQRALQTPSVTPMPEDEFQMAMMQPDADTAMPMPQQPAQPQDPAMAQPPMPPQPQDPAMAQPPMPPQPQDPAMAQPPMPPQPQDPAMAQPPMPPQPQDPAMAQPPMPPQPQDPAMAQPPMPPQPQDPAMAQPPTPSAPQDAAAPPPPLSEEPQFPLAAAEPQMQIPPSTLPAEQDALDWQETSQRELTGEELIPDSRMIPNLGIAQDDVEYDLGHAGEYPPPQELPPDFDLGTPSQDDTPLPFDHAGSPDVQVPPVPQAPQKEALSGPVPFSDPTEMTAPITELPEIIMPDSFPQAFAGEFSDEPLPPPPPEKSSSLAPAPRLTESDLDLAAMEFVELSAIHIDDAPASSDAGGEAIEEMPDQMLFEPGAQYSAGTPGQSAMPGMELGQLSQAENQDQQSESPAQPDMPTAGGAGGGEEEPSGEPPSPDTGPPPPPGAEPGGGEASMKAGTPSPPEPDDQEPQAQFPQPPGPEPGQQPSQQPPPPGQEQAAGQQPPAQESGHEMAHEPGEPGQEAGQSGAEGGEPPPGAASGEGSSGESPEQAPFEMPPQIASGLLRKPATEAELIQEYMERLERHRRAAESLPEHADWRDEIMDDDRFVELMTPMFDHLRQLGDLTPRLAPDAAVPEDLTLKDEPVDVALGKMADYSRELRRQLGDLDPEIEIDSAEHHFALAEALEFVSRAARAGDPSDAEAAALRMALVAGEARRRVEEMGLSTAPRITRAADEDDLPEDELRRLGLPVSDWLRLPGEVRSEVLQAAPADGPEEYRSLIQRYFSDIARDIDKDSQ